MNIYFVSLGCDKNRVDSEEMLGLLAAAGFSFCGDEFDADIIVINTCCFIDPAKEESIETILELSKMKTEGRCKRLIVTGCLAERYKDEIFKELPEVDAIVGVNELPKVIAACEPKYEDLKVSDTNRVITTPGHYEYLKIAEGCNKRCTYCAIPNIRGPYRSFPMEDLLDQANYLAQNGVKELIIVAQETTIYGKDLYGEYKLPELLHKLCEIEGIQWIRLLYAYPEDIDDSLIEVMANEEKILHYIDMPIQHCSDDILKHMGRRTSKSDIVKIIKKLRAKIPDIVLRTSLIAGFPGESEKDFNALSKFIKDVKFDRLGVFAYSQEDGTAAAKFENQVPEELKERRVESLMAVQENISEQNLKNKIGREFQVIVDGYLPEDDIYIGRTYMDTPDVDGYFYFSSTRQLMTGDFVKAICTGYSQYDLYGEMIDEPAE